MIDTKEVTKAALRDAAKLPVDHDVKIPRPKRREWAAAALFLCLSLAGLLAGRLGHIWISFDVFSQFTTQFMLGILAFAIALYFAKRQTTTVGFALTILFGAIYGATAYQGTWPQTQAPGAFSLMTFNIYKHNADAERIFASISKSNPDVVVLVEISEKNQDILRRVQQAYPYVANCKGWAACRHYIVSRYPILNSRFDHDNNVAVATLSLPSGEATVVGIHLTHFPRSSAQLGQALALSKFLDSVPKPTIVAGDFNATPASRIADILVNQNDMTRLTFRPTWPSTIGLPQLAIDHVYVSSGIELVAGPVNGDAGGSDHFPVLVSLKHATPKN